MWLVWVRCYAESECKRNISAQLTCRTEQLRTLAP
jgi:hypothetical protein